MSISVVHAKMIIFGMLAREYRKYFKSIVDDSVIVGNQGISDGNSVLTSATNTISTNVKSTVSINYDN